MKSYKLVPEETTVRGAIEDGINDLRELGEECREAYENMTGGGMSDDHPKVAAFSEAADQLEEADEPDMEGVPDDVLDQKLTVSNLTPKDKRRSAARWARCSNACGKLKAAAEALREHDPHDVDCEGDEEDADVEKRDEVEQACTELADTIEELADNCEGVEFPGLYGA